MRTYMKWNKTMSNIDERSARWRCWHLGGTGGKDCFVICECMLMFPCQAVCVLSDALRAPQMRAKGAGGTHAVGIFAWSLVVQKEHVFLRVILQRSDSKSSSACRVRWEGLRCGLHQFVSKGGAFLKPAVIRHLAFAQSVHQYCSLFCSISYKVLCVPIGKNIRRSSAI